MTSFSSKKSSRGIIWSAIERYSSQILQFVFLIILARLLSPADFGILAVMMSFILVSQEIIGGGFVQALVRKQDKTDADIITALIYNVLVSILCIVLLFISSQSVAQFWEYSEMTVHLRVLSLSLVFYAISVVPTAILTGKVDFKTQAYATTFAVTVSGGVAVIIAYNGGGLWAIVVQSVALNIVKAIVLWYGVKWNYKFEVSKRSFVELFSYGYKVSLYNLLDIGATQLTSLIIGKKYTAKDLGFYSKGQQFAMAPSVQLSYSISRAVFPLLSRFQINKSLLLAEFVKYLKMSSLLIVFFMLLLATLASPFVRFVLGEQWIEMVPYLQILCLAFMFDQMNSLNQTLLYTDGRSDLWLKLGVINRILAILIVLIALPFGPIVIAFSKFAHSQIELLINTYYSGKLYNMGYWRQMKYVLKYVLLSFVSCVIPYILIQYGEGEIMYAIIGGGFAVLVYLMLLWLVKDDIYMNVFVSKFLALIIR